MSIQNNQISLLDIPTSPGVYLYRNALGEIIYVGKAINLKKRVTQYFQRDDALGPKTASLVAEIADIETRVVGSEIEALVLEASLIKKHKPKFNSQLRDDKSYAYIVITKDKLPLIYSARRAQVDFDHQSVYGPFPDGGAVRRLLRLLWRIFPFYLKPHHPTKECLYCHLGLCPGPSPDPKIYRQNIRRIKKILSGKVRQIISGLKKSMAKYSLLEEYEKAAIIRDQIQSLEYITSGWHHLDSLFKDINVSDDKTSSALEGLQTTLLPYFPYLSHIYRIECYDISNLGPNFFVGSMSVFQGDGLNKNEYRKFKIKTKVSQDDQFMIREIVFRRLRHYDWEFPQIIVVDGGKPQVSSIYQILSAYPDSPLKNMAVIGLAKKLETIVIYHHQQWVEINLPQNSNSLLLLEQLRDEAHRFANQYRKQLIARPLSG